MSKPDAATEPLWLRRTAEGFVPASEIDQQIVSERWGVGSLVRAKLTKPRSSKQNNFYWAIVRVVVQHQELFPTVPALDHWLTIKLGHVDHIVVGSEVYLIPKSKDFDHMEAGEFNAYVDAVLRLIWSDVIPGMDAAGRKEMLDQIDKMGKR